LSKAVYGYRHRIDEIILLVCATRGPVVYLMDLQDGEWTCAFGYGVSVELLVNSATWNAVLFASRPLGFVENGDWRGEEREGKENSSKFLPPQRPTALRIQIEHLDRSYLNSSRSGLWKALTGSSSRAMGRGS
jgi:hypothetical protein